MSDELVFKDGYYVRRVPYAAPPAAVLPPPRPCPQCGTALNRQPGTLNQRGFYSCSQCEHCEVA